MKTLIVLAALAAVECRAETTDVVQTAPAAGLQNPYLISDTLGWTSFSLGAASEVEHVLRFRAGWPFDGGFNAFTVELLLLPCYLVGKFLDAGPLVWVPFETAALAAMIALNLVQPADQPSTPLYGAWAYGNNRLGVQSPLAGGAAQALSVVATASAAAQLAASVIDGVRLGWTVKRRRPASLATSWVPDVQVAPRSGGALASLSWTW